MTRDQAEDGLLADRGAPPMETETQPLMSPCVWSSFPDDLFARVLSRLQIQALVRSRTVCRDWNRMVQSPNFIHLQQQVPPPDQPSWLLMCSSFNCRENCCAYDPNSDQWHKIPLTFLPSYMRFLLITLGGLLFVRGVVKESNASGSARLAVCNPVTRAWRELPPLICRRVNSLVGAIEDKSTRSFKVIVAGGSSACGKDYECSTEVYDSLTDSWHIAGTVPRDHTVKITVWTSNTVSCNGILYCLTSARPYNIMAYDMKRGMWEEVRIQQPEELLYSFLFARRGQLMLVGGVGLDRMCQSVHIWELKDGGPNWEMQPAEKNWVEIECMPEHHLKRFCQGKISLNLKCAGSGDMVYFYQDSHSEMLLWDSSQTPTAWRWLPICPLKARFSVRGLFIEPRLDANVF